MKKILLTVILVVGVLVIVGLFLPTEYNIKRELEINASSEKLYELIGDLKSWEKWSPWKDEDPTLQIEYGEQTLGVGAGYSWVGEKSGNGRLEITKADPDSGIEYDLFFEGYENKYIAGLHYEPISGENRYIVSMSMEGEENISVIGGYMLLLMKPELKKMFDKGLKKLKKEAESSQ